LPLIGFALVASAAPRTLAAQSGLQTVVLTDANLIDGASDQPIRGAMIVIRGGLIERVGTGSTGIPADAHVVNMRGYWVLPGFIDVHAHIADLASARRAVRSGTTTARILGSEHFVDVGMRELNRGGMSDIPTILAAGYQVRPDMLESFFLEFPDMASWMKGLRGPDNLRQVVRMLAGRHVDQIKILATERAGTPESDPLRRTFTDDEIAAVVDEARKAGLPVAAHAHGDEGARSAVLAGVRTIEHGSYLSDETLALMKARGTYLVPTISVASDNPALSPVVRLRLAGAQPRSREIARRASNMGVKVVAGTDRNYGEETIGRVPDEIEELVRSAIPTMDAIKAATSRAAECLGIDRRTGIVRAGMAADLIAISADPLHEVSALHDIVMVVHGGKVIVNRLDVGPSPPPTP